MTKKNLQLLLFILLTSTTFAQKGMLRGNIYNKATGEPLAYVNVVLKETPFGTTTNQEGFYSFNVPVGNYTVTTNLLGYAPMEVPVQIGDGAILYQRFDLTEKDKDLETIEISGSRDAARNTVQISKITITQKQLKALPSTGGEPDIAQYLTILPGVISTGDQGGQIYIRGGSPVQNKILLDGMPIYNPFHSIGFFSVFETETIRSADVFTGGFNAEYGGRISAIMDLKTREGNKKRFSGIVSGSPFQAKIVLEAPLSPLSDDGKGGSSSVLFTAKQSLLDKTANHLYKYATRDSFGLPFAYTDIYGKISFNAARGSKFNFFGFNFKDKVSYTNLADLNWNNRGGGANFTLVPAGLSLVINGAVSYSDYQMQLLQGKDDPRKSGITSTNATLDFTYFGSNNNEIKYGVELNNISTRLQFKNFLGFTFDDQDNSTELAGFFKYRWKTKALLLEPGLRVQYYASLGIAKMEPRFAAKINISDKFRLKFSGGLYSQNLLSTVNERDIVNLFVGYLSGPEYPIYQQGTQQNIDERLQTAYHIIGGIEVDLSKYLEINVEPYLKNYTQLIQVNRNKTQNADPNYVVETGRATGLDITAKYEKQQIYVWAAYSIGYVNRKDETQAYPTTFDRRHNLNIGTTYTFGKQKSWELGGRFNYGSGFPFTLTQGFYTKFDYNDGLNTDILKGNPNHIGVIYSDKRNTGRLPAYARFDVSIKKSIAFSKNTRMEIIGSVTNAANRNNIFYFDRIQYQRVDQLPILPSLAMTLHF
jgi:CarboxypepD_reg-like domain/TonB-dependent Receptor Plug Domain